MNGADHVDAVFTVYTRAAVITDSWDAQGRIIRDEDAAGGFFVMTTTPTNAGSVTTKTSALGRLSTYTNVATASQSTRTVVGPDGLSTVQVRDQAGSWGHPRCSMMGPLARGT